jgi:hypothetical protein
MYRAARTRQMPNYDCEDKTTILDRFRFEQLPY